MAQYAAQGNVLSDELEYLQAYEDVLERYKGKDRRRSVCCLRCWDGKETV